MRHSKNSTTAKRARTSRTEMETSSRLGRHTKSSRKSSTAKNCK